MTLLLDTHVFLGWLHSMQLLFESARQAMGGETTPDPLFRPPFPCWALNLLPLSLPPTARIINFRSVLLQVLLDDWLRLGANHEN